VISSLSDVYAALDATAALSYGQISVYTQRNMAKKQQENLSPRIVNRKARHDYQILDSMEVGIVLQGSEVKAVRHSLVTLGEGFARIEPNDMKLILHNVEIGQYTHASGGNGHEPNRPRVLLAHKRQIKKLFDETSSSGRTLVPLTMYFVRGKVKIELGIGQGKKQHDKRQDIKQRESDRDIRRALSKRR